MSFMVAECLNAACLNISLWVTLSSVLYAFVLWMREVMHLCCFYSIGFSVYVCVRLCVCACPVFCEYLCL